MGNDVSDNEALTERIGQLERAKEIDSRIADRTPPSQQNGGDKYARREYLFLLVTICGFLFAVVFRLIVTNSEATDALERRHDKELGIIAEKHADDRRQVSSWMAYSQFYMANTCQTMRSLAMAMQPGAEIPECMEPSSFPPLD